MRPLLIYLLPSEAFLPALVISGFLIIIGFKKIGLAIFGAILLKAFLSPVVKPLLAQLPPEVFWILIIVGFFIMLRIVLGRRVLENVLSYLVYDLIRAPFRFLVWLLQGGRRLPRG